MLDTERPEHDLGPDPESNMPPSAGPCCVHCAGLDDEPAPPTRSATLAMIETIEYAVVNLPWAAIAVLAWGWAIYQVVRIVSLLQDIVNEHVRMFDRAMLMATHQVVEAAISGVAGALVWIASLLMVLAIYLILSGIVLTWRWWRARRSAS